MLDGELQAISAKAPDHYYDLTDEQKKYAVIDDSVCTIKHPHQSDFFIKAFAVQKLSDAPGESLEYGVWVSVSERQMLEYLEKGNDEGFEAIWAGYLCSTSPGYYKPYDVKMNLIVKGGDQVPEAVPQEDQEDKPFARDYYHGITKSEAFQKVHETLNGPSFTK